MLRQHACMRLPEASLSKSHAPRDFASEAMIQLVDALLS